jgi:selenide,water dikinase
MARIAAIHALGDVWAMGAAPQAVLAQITLPPASDAKSTQMLAEVMGAASSVITAAGADLVGGHSATGAELTIGFTVTGLPTAPILTAGAKVGDALILTKPLGSGIIMAAEMALARLDTVILGEAVAAALTQMQRGQGAASALLAPHAHAMTDVTGFGLAGHLLEMAQGANLQAQINFSQIPVIEEALEYVQNNIVTGASGRNWQGYENQVTAEGELAQWQKNLLSDPQTSGGLLISCAPEVESEVLEYLHQSGFISAQKIGQFAQGQGIKIDAA